MKKLLSCLLLSLFVSTAFMSAQTARPIGNGAARPAQAGQAQPGQQARLTAEERIKQQVTTLEKELTLNATQKAKLTTVLTDNAAAQRKMMESMQGQGQDVDREKMRADMEKSRAAQTAKVKEVLTPEQFTKYTKWQETQRGQRGRGGMGGPQGGMGGPQGGGQGRPQGGAQGGGPR